MTAEQYLSQLQALLPLGAAWPRDAEATLTKLLQAFSDELARVDGRAAALIDEADPRTTSELLTDWERVAGLPDSCVAVEQSTAQRIAALVTKLTTIGGQSATYYIALAATLGYAITITEFHEHSVDDDVDYPLYSAAWQFAWQVNAPLNTIFELSVDDSVDDPLASWGNEALECVINRLKPAHTHVLFAYA
ncbi:MAG: DUF2313 domain-containing protein [Burkholderiales bacterium]|nr:DUF2313 domain-containing protein [Burkholderiales bacterium]